MATEVIAAGCTVHDLSLVYTKSQAALIELAGCAYRLGVGTTSPYGDGIREISTAIGTFHEAMELEMRTESDTKRHALRRLLDQWSKSKKAGT